MRIENISDFKKAIDSVGYDNFWDIYINAYLSRIRPDFQLPINGFDIDIESNLFSYDNIGDLYEIALEHNNQISKKELGQYYTPKDVCRFMAKKLLSEYKNEYNLADVCCGTGNLIIEVLKQLGEHEVRSLIYSKKLYLYDLDPIAIKLAVMKIGIMFAEKNDYKSYLKITQSINVSVGNFLSESVKLPNGCYVISNPPYGRLSSKIELWSQCSTGNTKDLYSVFIEKISQQAQRSVIITPQSFLGGAKFSTLRFAMARNGGGEIYSFDNVPSPLFCGRKKGVFNSNTSNSVRAAITLIDKNKHGFRLSPMIRFKSEERIKLFSDIESLLGEKIYTQPYVWTKIPKTLEELVDAMNALPYKVSDFIEKDKTKQDEKLRLTIPQTPRYFISATSRDLNRTSKILIYAKDEASFYKLYLLINSSFSYLWWRIYDGGITLGKSTLLSLPVPDIDDDEKLNNMVKTYIGLEDSFLVNKLNAGKNNENVKFPPKYRSKLNQYLLNYFGLEGKSEQLLSIHSNTFTDYSKYWR